MSLIEEALRKQREETEQTGQSAAIPPPLPHDPAPESIEGTAAAPRRPWAMLTGLILIGILSLAFILWLLFFGLHLWQKTPDPANTPVIAAVPKAPSIPSAPPDPPPKLEPVVVTNTPPVIPPIAPVTNAVVMPVITTVPPAPLVTNPPAVNIVKEILPVIWPKLLVTGIIGRKGGQSAVIINGQMLSPGDSLEGVKIEGIEKQRAKLVFQGEIKLLAAGGSTE